jgi:SAM-dependent methyltransferase
MTVVAHGASSLHDGMSAIPRRRRALDPNLVAWYFELLGPVDNVLDLGCGQGDIGRHRPQRIRSVVGADAAENALRIAASHEAVCLWNGESGSLPFRDGVFDAIVAKDVLEHLGRPWLIVAEMHRVLRHGGRVIASVPMARASAVWDDYTHVRGFTRTALKALFEDHGFAAQKPMPMGGVPFAGRAGLVRRLPQILSIPPLGRLFGSSYMIVATKP